MLSFFAASRASSSSLLSSPNKSSAMRGSESDSSFERVLCSSERKCEPSWKRDLLDLRLISPLRSDSIASLEQPSLAKSTFSWRNSSSSSSRMSEAKTYCLWEKRTFFYFFFGE